MGELVDGEGNDQVGNDEPAATPPGSGTIPTFEPPPSYASPASFGAPPTDAPPGPGGALPPSPPPAPPTGPPAWRSLLSSPGPVDGPRPAPTLVSMLAVGGGLLAAAGMFFLLGELDGYDQRMAGLAISMIFLVLGVALSTINRSKRSATAGVAISALAVIPLTVFLFANADVFGDLDGRDLNGNPYDGIRGVVTLMLIAAAVVWMLGYLLGPGRRYGVYLGAALVALWLIPMSNMQITAIEDTFSGFSSSSTFTTIPDGSGFSSGSGPSFDDPTLGTDFGSSSESGDGFTFQAPEVADPSTKMGMVSLAFGAVYLALAALRDRKGDARMATAALFPAILILVYANSLLTTHVGWAGRGLLAMATGAALLVVGVRGGRRASSWIGLLLATVGFGSLVVEALGDSPRATGAALTVLGIALALVVGMTESATPVEGDPSPGGGDAGPPATPPAFAAPADAPAPSAPPAADPTPWSQSF